MAKKAGFGLAFEGFTDMIKKIDEAGKDIKIPIERAMSAGHKELTDQVDAHFRGKYHNSAGGTLTHLISTGALEWDGTVLTINYGFDLKNGGFPSIFLMYGTPHVAPDKKLFNLLKLKGSNAKKLNEIQEKAIADYLREVGL